MFFWYKLTDLVTIIRILQDHQVGIAATDTVYGLLASLAPESFERLNTLKLRQDKPYLILIPNADALPSFVEMNSVSPQLRHLLARCWPGPVTIIFKAKKGLPSHFASGRETIGLRAPQHEGLQEILKHLPGLFSTSANVAGAPAPSTLAEIDAQLLSRVDFVVSDRPGELDKRAASTILDCTKPGIVRIVREGQFPIQLLEEYYGESFSR